ncbi:MAG: hypothetical protein IKU20_08335 [Lachnospiraceae bacterium]|nr:hypothetical protein [Lachnospiraceae bacterium]
MKNKQVILWVVLMGIFSFLFGCAKNKEPVDTPLNGNTGAAKETVQDISKPEGIAPIELAEGVTLTGFYMNQMGMARAPYYMMKVTESGTYMKISTSSPDDYEMWKDDDSENLEQPSEYFGYIETVKDVEYASHVKLEDDTVIRQMEECIEKYGALGWDGYSKKEDMPGVMDSGDSYNLYLELSDGTTVTMQGYNTCPAGFHDLYGDIVKIFDANSDYSRYMAKNFTDSPCNYMEVEIRDMESWNAYYQIRLRDTSNQWAITLNDPDGVILEKGTEISGYKETEEKLPYERFLNIMSEHGVEAWNQYEESTNSSAGKFYITMYFEDGKEFSANGNVYPNGFEAFKEAFVKEIYAYYLEVQE